MILAGAVGSVLACPAAWSAGRGWSVGSGIAAPAQAAAVRLNPASVAGLGSAAQLGARYAVVTGGPIMTADAAWATPGSSWVIGGGGEYSLGTSNPEAHVGIGMKVMGVHSAGLDAGIRQTASVSRTTVGVSAHSRWSDRFETAFRFAGIGEGKEALELALGGVVRGLPMADSRLEIDLGYATSSRSISLRPSLVAALPWWNLVAAVAFDAPLDRIASFGTAATLGYEGERMAAHLQLASSLAGSAAFSMKF